MTVDAGTGEAKLSLGARAQATQTALTGNMGRRVGGRLRRMLAAAALALLGVLAVAASPAVAAYYPSGPQAFVDKGQLDGWELCFSGLYNGTESLDTVLTQCDGDPLLLAGGPTGSATLTVLAAAPRADVLFDTGTSNTPHDANGSGWYFNDDYSWGFAKQGDPINRVPCDLGGANPELRLCWHTFDGSLFGGWRAGATQNLNDSVDYTRYIYQGVAELALKAKPKKRRVEVGEKAKFKAKLRTTGLPANGVEVCMKPKRAGGALKPSKRKCKAVGALDPGAQATKSFKVKAKPKAAGKKFKLKLTAAGAGLETVARQATLVVGGA
jgi:hypothetical protein